MLVGRQIKMIETTERSGDGPGEARRIVKGEEIDR